LYYMDGPRNVDQLTESYRWDNFIRKRSQKFFLWKD
jgi:hypothetical protein